MGKISKLYFGILGSFALISGIVDLIITFGGRSLSTKLLQIPNDGFRGGWGGLVILFAGIFYLNSLNRKYSLIQQLSRIVIANILIWIIAGSDIFGMFCESIPGGEERWFNGLSDFFATYAPPYPPAIWLLPFSLVAIYYVKKYFRAVGNQ